MPRTGAGIGMVVSWLTWPGYVPAREPAVARNARPPGCVPSPRCVSATDGRAEGDHVPVRVGALEQTALEACVDHHDVRHLAKQGLVAASAPAP